LAVAACAGGERAYRIRFLPGESGEWTYLTSGNAPAPFHKIRMCVFPESYTYNRNEPACYPFERDAAGQNGYSRFNPKSFQHIERRVRDLAAGRPGRTLKLPAEPFQTVRFQKAE
jgi:hypothetical protein